MVLSRGGYYFNSTGLLACDPFFSRPSLRILSSCLFYFPTTMILMYCYGSAFHVNKLRLKRVVCSAVANPDDAAAANVDKVFTFIYTIYGLHMCDSSQRHAQIVLPCRGINLTVLD
jgi:hypothetical protein